MESIHPLGRSKINVQWMHKINILYNNYCLLSIVCLGFFEFPWMQDFYKRSWHDIIISLHSVSPSITASLDVKNWYKLIYFMFSLLEIHPPPPQLFQVLFKFLECFHYSIETQRTLSISFRKKNLLFARIIITSRAHASCVAIKLYSTNPCLAVYRERHPLITR